MIQVKALSITLGEFALRDVTFNVNRGEYVVIMGPTGSGKTVLLECMMGLYRAERGEIWIHDRRVDAEPPERRGLAYVPQDYCLFPHMSLRDNIAYGMVVRRFSAARQAETIHSLAELLGIAHLLNRRALHLSGGERQRGALARALAVQPDVLLLDEPLSAVDQSTRDGLCQMLKRLQRELGVTTVHVSHSLDEALAVGDRIAIFGQGSILQEAEPEEIIRRPNCEFVALFTGCENIVAGQVSRSAEGSEFRRDELRLQVDCDWQGAGQVVIRPEDIRLMAEPSPERENILQGRVVSSGNRGSFWKFVVEVGGVEWSVLCSRHEAQALGLSVGMAVSVEFPVPCLHALHRVPE